MKESHHSHPSVRFEGGLTDQQPDTPCKSEMWFSIQKDPVVPSKNQEI
jgi:hypothetical protein